MRSSPSVVLVAALGCALGACGTDSVNRPLHEPDDDPSPIEVNPDVCETSFLDYQNFGAAFVSNWCRGCHSSDVPLGMRQKAPIDANFDNLAQIQMWGERMERRVAVMQNMPPAGGPSHEERELLAEWMTCGMN